MTSKNRTPALSGADHDALTGTFGTDTSDIELDGLNKSIVLDKDMSLEDLRDSLNAPVSYDVNDPHFQKFTADSAFMEERVMVRVLPSSDPTSLKIVETGCNGVKQFFIRDQWVIARRKFVEVLARAKPFSVSTPEVFDGNGDRTTRIDTSTGHLYPFQMKDPNPIGEAWLNKILRES